jgi:FixJ family two-component response regulator
MAEPEPVVFIVDDDMSVREAVQGLVRSAGLRVETFASAQDFLSAHAPAGPSCLVLDVYLPDLSGLDLQRRMTEAGFQIPIIFITAHGDVPTSVGAMKAGAVEFLIKPFEARYLLEAVQAAIKRDRAGIRQRAESEGLRKRFESLTPREREVMKLIVLGMLNKQAAAEIGTSEATIKVHRGRVMQKMQADSLADLVNMAADLGMRNARKS